MPTSAEILNLAVRYHQGGNLAQAEPLYRQILEAEPANAEAHHLLGLLAHQTGRHEAAVALLRHAIDLNPAAAGVHFNLGIVLMSQKQYAQAASCFQQTLRFDPRHVEGHINLGNAFFSQGQFAEAAQCYRNAIGIQPLHADAHINLGNAFLNQGKLDEASETYREAVRINPQHAHAHVNLGMTLLGRGQLDEAGACFREALRLDPANAKAHFHLANIHQSLGRMVEAEEGYRQSLRLNPGHAEAHNCLGDVLVIQRQHAQAAECYRQALRLDPNSLSARGHLGRALFWQGQLAEAAECFQHVLRGNPNNAEALDDLGLALRDQGRIAEAAECFERALDIDFGQGVPLWNRCLLRLLQGDFAGGWPDIEQRWQLPGAQQRSFQQPRWDGSPLEGKTILVFSEMGLGDTIHFLRYLPMVKERGGNVVFECQPALINLFAGIKGVDQLIPAGAPLPSFDVQYPLLSLPALFGTTLDTIPAESPYLHANPQMVEHWRKEMGHESTSARAAGSGLNIGIAWQANFNHQGQCFKSAPLKFFEALAAVENVRLFSLQVGQGTEQLATATFPITDLGSRFDPNSLEDLAAVMMNLDLVVTIDTAVPHLAGALGVPVWVALPLVGCWRWLLERSDSPWYPTMRLFRQKKLHDWGEVFERIAAELRERMTR